MAKIESIELEHRRHLRGVLGDERDMKQRIGNLEDQYDGMSSRFDRVDLRIERIERRLHLTGA